MAVDDLSRTSARTGAGGREVELEELPDLPPDLAGIGCEPLPGMSAP
jgi:hypothetical protein